MDPNPLQYYPIKIMVRKYKSSFGENSNEWLYRFYFVPSHQSKILFDEGPFTYDEFIKELANHGLNWDIKFVPFTKYEEQCVQIGSQGEKFVEESVSIKELEKIVDDYYELKRNKKAKESIHSV
jgi:hypothetical protein